MSLPEGTSPDQTGAFGRESGAVLLDPPLDVSLAPDAPGCQLANRLREGLGAGELIGALLAHAESRGDLGYAHKLHRDAVYPLTASTVKCYAPLDIIKRPRVAVTTGAAT